MEENILNINKLKIVCNNCKTEVTLSFDAEAEGGGVYHCPKCQNSFGIDQYDDVFSRLKDLIKSVGNNKKAEFRMLCEATQ